MGTDKLLRKPFKMLGVTLQHMGILFWGGGSSNTPSCFML